MLAGGTPFLFKVRITMSINVVPKVSFGVVEGHGRRKLFAETPSRDKPNVGGPQAIFQKEINLAK